MVHLTPKILRVASTKAEKDHIFLLQSFRLHITAYICKLMELARGGRRGAGRGGAGRGGAGREQQFERANGERGRWNDV